MKKNKPWALAALLAAALLFSMNLALAEGETELRIDATEPNADGTFTATVHISAGTKVAGVQFALSYDDSALELVSAKNGSMARGGISATNDEEAGNVVFIWTAMTGTKTEGDVLVLTFKAKDGAKGATSIAFDEGKTSSMIIDNDLKDIPFESAGASIDLGGGGAAATTAPATGAPAATEAPAATDAPSAGIIMDSGESKNVAGELALDPEKSYIWSSSNERVATVDENGVVTATGDGEATISAISEDGAEILEKTLAVGEEAAALQPTPAPATAPAQTETAPAQTPAEAATTPAAAAAPEGADPGLAIDIIEGGEPSWAWLYILIALAGAAALGGIGYMIFRQKRR